MLAMQYAFGFNETFDMGTIRKRVAERGPVFDRLSGLVQKSFLCTDRSGRGPVPAAVNQYATFYLWRTPEAAAQFLTGELFEAVVHAFGRPQVRLMPVLCFDVGDTTRPPAVAGHMQVSAPQDMKLGDLSRRERDIHRGAMERPGVFSHVAALDPERWDVVRFTLYHGPDRMSGDPAEHAYELLHLSVPFEP